MYRAKGFSGKLLDDVVDVLMADDNRLLKVMMEEEMGLVLRGYEHPIKQALFSSLGAALSSFFLIFALKGSIYEFFLVGAFIVILSSFYHKRENLSFIIIWNLAILALISFLT